MFHIKPELPAADITTEHPWARRIKDAFVNKIKYAHNSIKNPEYPKKKEKNPPDPNRIKFTIIGDRVTKEFIYCINLVKGLYKYRKTIFEAPVIQGVTTVEWPKIWGDLKTRYGGMAYCLTSSVAVLIGNKFLGGEKELKEFIESKYTYHLCLDYHKESVAEFAKFIRGSGRPFVYMKISINGEDAGTFIFMLFADILPFTCANFLRLCKETRGGYSGTPIHRIVKDGWIQGGGFGLKETDLDCENFIVPHDRRGVLCMANSGLHTECSTQFFVLLQPAPWMAHKFVAFGQLIEGKETLEKIEAVPTWYESPNSEIIIYKAGIFNMDCHDIMINKNTNEYIDRHIDDLNDLGEVFYAALLENVFLTAQLRELERLKQQEGEGGEEEDNGAEDGATGLRTTKRFNRRKEDIEKQLQTSKEDRKSQPSAVVSRAADSSGQRPTSASANENNDFDVETYDPEYEETDYQHQSIRTPSLIVKPKKPFYIPLTDVLYPEEKDSNFDLKRFLQGDYCLESDLKEQSKSFIPREALECLSDLFDFDDSESEDEDSSEEREIKKYLKSNVDRVSFAGGVVKRIAKGSAKFNLLEDHRKSELITDDQLRRLRLAAIDQKSRDQHKKVSISMPSERPTHIQIKRRQTGFVRPEDLEKIRGFARFGVPVFDDDDDEDEDDDDDDKDGERKVRMAAEDTADEQPPKAKRRGTTFVRPKIDFDEDDDEDDDDEPEPKQKVRMVAEDTADEQPPKAKRRGTTFVRPKIDFDEDDDEDDDNKPEPKQKVRMVAEDTADEQPPSAKRRGTTFVRAKIDSDEDDDEDDDDEPAPKQKICIAPTPAPTVQVKSRPPVSVRTAVDDDDDDDDRDSDDDDEVPDLRQSVLVRLFDEVEGNDELPTLKDYKPMSEYRPKTLLTFSSNYRIKSESESNREQNRYMRHSIRAENHSFDNVLNLQHGKKVARKISSDYVKTIDQIEHGLENSIRSVEFAKTRPAISVVEYQKKNRKYQEEQKSSIGRGLRLPGDTPCHSHEDISVLKEKYHEKDKEKPHKPHKHHHSRS